MSSKNFSKWSFVANPKDDVDELAIQFHDDISEITHRHAPIVEEIVDREWTPWFTDDCNKMKLNKRRAERKYRGDKSAINLDILQHTLKQYKETCHIAKSNFYRQKIKDCNKDQKALIKIVNNLLHRYKESRLPSYMNAFSLANDKNW